jgi:hypothetical protein
MNWPAIHRRALLRRHAIGAALLLAGFASGCPTTQLPRAATPQHVVPDVDLSAPPPEGYGRLIIDVVEGPSYVQQVRMNPESFEGADGRPSYEIRESYEDLCDTTPCVLDLRPGNIILGFPVIGDEAGLKIDLVHVGSDTSVYRRSLDIYDPRKGGPYKFGIFSAAFGASAVIVGLPMVPVGFSDGRYGLGTAGAVTLGVGAALMALGIRLIKVHSPTHRPGNWTHYPLSVETDPR